MTTDELIQVFAVGLLQGLAQGVGFMLMLWWLL